MSYVYGSIWNSITTNLRSPLWKKKKTSTSDNTPELSSTMEPMTIVYKSSDEESSSANAPSAPPTSLQPAVSDTCTSSRAIYDAPPIAPPQSIDAPPPASQGVPTVEIDTVRRDQPSAPPLGEIYRDPAGASPQAPPQGAPPQAPPQKQQGSIG